MKNEQKVIYTSDLKDRLVFAREVAKGRRVLDVGGAGMPACDKPHVHGVPSVGIRKGSDPTTSPFALAYQAIRSGAREYRVVDQPQPGKDLLIDHPLDLNHPDSVAALSKVLAEYRPEVILCMETLEHLNYHFEIMNEFARCVERDRAEVFISLPNNANWILNALGWNHDHCVGFFREIAARFVSRSDLGNHEVIYVPCFQKYLWYWPLAYAASFCQPFSLGFHIKPRK
ncbi:MAG: hypothetical protein WDM76_00730 [Limisphaerales bacterium]